MKSDTMKKHTIENVAELIQLISHGTRSLQTDNKQNRQRQCNKNQQQNQTAVYHQKAFLDLFWNSMMVSNSASLVVDPTSSMILVTDQFGFIFTHKAFYVFYYVSAFCNIS